MPKMSEGFWRSVAAITASVIVMGAVAGMFVSLVAGILAGLVMLPVAIAVDWETRRRREIATRSRATEAKAAHA
jgi:hypothetical protein